MNLIIQLILLVFTALIVTGISLLVYRIALDVLSTTKSTLKAHNVDVSGSGAKIGVKSVGREDLIDGIQRQVVGAWHKSSTPGYKGSWLFGGGSSNNDDSAVTSTQQDKKSIKKQA